MYTDERNILDVKGQSLIHALAPLFTIHRELKSKSVWQREDMSPMAAEGCFLRSAALYSYAVPLPAGAFAHYIQHQLSLTA